MVLTPLLVGLAASSALVIGATAGVYFDPGETVVSATLAFASGALITALAYDLFEEAFRIGGVWIASGGLLAGATVFIAYDEHLRRTPGGESGFALLASVTFDGVPENLALGVTLIGSSVGHVLALLVAIFASNLPEALGGAKSMIDNGHSKRFAIGTWAAAGALLAAAVVVGNVVFAGLGQSPLAAVRAFAGGAVLASLAATIMPHAYADVGPMVAFATTAGFLSTFLLTHA